MTLDVRLARYQDLTETADSAPDVLGQRRALETLADICYPLRNN
jgi:hypothetical protein